MLTIAVHALPYVYRDVPGRQGLSVAVRVTGRASGTWTLRRSGGTWDLDEGLRPDATAIATMSDEVAWRLFFNALPLSEAQSAVQPEGDVELARPLLHARAVIV